MITFSSHPAGLPSSYHAAQSYSQHLSLIHISFSLRMFRISPVTTQVIPCSRQYSARYLVILCRSVSYTHLFTSSYAFGRLIPICADNSCTLIVLFSIRCCSFRRVGYVRLFNNCFSATAHGGYQSPQ